MVKYKKRFDRLKKSAEYLRLLQSLNERYELVTGGVRVISYGGEELFYKEKLVNRIQSLKVYLKIQLRYRKNEY